MWRRRQSMAPAALHPRPERRSLDRRGIGCLLRSRRYSGSGGFDQPRRASAASNRGISVESREQFAQVCRDTGQLGCASGVATESSRNLDGNVHCSSKPKAFNRRVRRQNQNRESHETVNPDQPWYSAISGLSPFAYATTGSGTSSVCPRYFSNSASLGAIGSSVSYSPAKTSVVFRPLPVMQSTVVSLGRMRSLL